MKAAWYEQTGPAREVLKVGTMPDPEPATGEVRVRMAVSAVNPSDWKTRAGNRPMVGPRVIPHSDGAGTIDQVGDGVPKNRIGERVWVWNAQWHRPFGTAAEYVVLPAEQAVKLDAATSFEAGACLGIPALTAYRAMTVDGPVDGATVLVTGGAGVVASYAIQFARLLGARTILTTVSSPEKAEIALAAGADTAINYRTEPVADRVLELTDGRGVDRIVEVDAATNAELLPHIIARDGLCVVYGSSAPQMTYTFGPLILSGVAIRYFIVYELAHTVRSKAIDALNDWMQRGLIQHGKTTQFPLTEIVAAHEAVERGEVIGKVLVVP